jgi:cell wall-associated NlpC family hydrolase
VVDDSPTGRAVQFALAQLGKPYVFFTKGASTFDCSGLTLAAYSQIGIELVHNAAAQATQGKAVDYWHTALQAGDLVFLDGDWDGEIDHVGMAINATSWVQASESNGGVVTGPLPSDSVIVAVRRMV